jgi:DNA processing protein
MVLPFASTNASRGAFLARNRVLVALADAVVVVQAGLPSGGALNAASSARWLQKPLWVVPAAPRMMGFEGSRELLDQGAR